MRIIPVDKCSVIIELTNSRSGYRFLIEEQERAGGEAQLKVTSPDDSDGRIMYGTEQGNSGAEYVLLIK